MVAKADTPELAAIEGPKSGGGRKKLLLLLLLVVPLLLGAAGAAAWFSGLLSPAPAPDPAAEEARATAARQPVFVEIPEVTSNLHAPGRRAVFIRMRARLEVIGQADAAALRAALPRIMDLFQTYLREMRPEELRGSAGTQRLREELVARANLVAAPARVVDMLFEEIIIQ